MPDLRYPNETEQYRKARQALLEEERRLVEKVKSVAEKRRALPLGGKLKEDYIFSGASNETLGKDIRFSDLFGDKNTLLLYSFMYGDSWDKPCPSCTSLVDGFDRVANSVGQNAALAVVAKASPKKLNAWAGERGWADIQLISAESNSYLTDYQCQTKESDDGLQPVMHVFTKNDGGIYHFWGSELQGNHVDTVWIYWNMMDMTPEGRPDRMTPPQNFRSRFLEKEYLGAD